MKQGITRREREITDIEEIIGILDRAKTAHIGMIDGARPYVVPMNYGYTLEDGKLTLYLHGALKGRKIDVLRANPNVFVEIDTDIVPFVGKVACQYGVSYSSVMGEGVAEIVEDAAEKGEVLKRLMKTQIGGDFEFSEKMVGGISAIKIHLDYFTAKKRPLPKQG